MSFITHAAKQLGSAVEKQFVTEIVAAQNRVLQIVVSGSPKSIKSLGSHGDCSDIAITAAIMSSSYLQVKSTIPVSVHQEKIERR
jgi:hypothetical protein